VDFTKTIFGDLRHLKCRFGGHGQRQDFLCRGKVGAKPRAWRGKEKSILLNIKRVRKLKY